MERFQYKHNLLIHLNNSDLLGQQPEINAVSWFSGCSTNKKHLPFFGQKKPPAPEREQLLCQLSSPRRYRPTHRILGHSDLVVHVLYGEPAAAATRQRTMGKAWEKMMKIMAGWISWIPPKYCWAGWSFELQRGRLFLKRSKTLKKYRDPAKKNLDRLNKTAVKCNRMTSSGWM